MNETIRDPSDHALATEDSGIGKSVVVNFFRTPQSVIVRPLAAHTDWAARSPVSSAIAPRYRTAR
ncbi:hypothetical protein, partial [Pseudomonas amygdali]